MPSTSERRALTLVTVVFALGVGTRLTGIGRDEAPRASADLRALDAQIARVESARAAGRGAARAPSRRSSSRSAATRPTPARRSSARASAPPPREPTPVDLDAASQAEIEGLPWVGPALAQRIVASREKCGAFGSLQALTRVYGIGGKLAARLQPHVTFSGASRPMDAVRPGCAGTAPAAATRRRSRS